ncbi:MAG TPA: Zn-ribbon domain-containing OB-fold protein [Blastocatellia bacterium]|nr:Zn-ribbon domain-containing OB-fold protein [Blastocatellia bacterium]
MILEGDITIPYKWTTGATTGRFLAELKENARLVGARCQDCGKVYVPPPDLCGECYRPLGDWVPLSGEGTVVAITNVERRMPWSPSPTPYALGLIRLDGADTNLLHMVAPGVKAGDRVAAVFKAARSGVLLDIETFVALDATDARADDQQQTPNVGAETKTESQSRSSTGGTSTQMETFKEVSEVFRALPGNFHQEKADENLSFYFSIDGEQWTVLVTPESCDVQPGKTVENADCFLKTSAEIFLGTINGTYTPSMTDLVMGKVKTNNPFLLQKFRDLFA